MVPDADGKNPSGVRGERYRLRGPSRIDPPQPAPATKRVLFVCIGNSCRSQMAEAFAKSYGADIMEVHSAGLAPASYIAPLTKQTLGEWNLHIDDHFPKGLDVMQQQSFDVVVNMSGTPLRRPGARVVDWMVPDPIGQSEDFYRTVATQIEGLVMRLILELRAPA